MEFFAILKTTGTLNEETHQLKYLKILTTPLYKFMKLSLGQVTLSSTFSHGTAHPKLVFNYLLGRQACKFERCSPGLEEAAASSHPSLHRNINFAGYCSATAQEAKRLLALLSWPHKFESYAYTHHYPSPFQMVKEMK